MDMDATITMTAAAVEKIEDCEVCGKNKAKYTCPKCEVRTCSLTCSTVHKKELECDGIRDKTKYLPIKSITDSHLMSDYCFLQGVGRSVDKYNRDPLNRFTPLNNFLPKYLRSLKSAAFRRGINLEFMPRNFSRSKQNTTRFISRNNELLWRIEWIFPDAENIKWATERASENARLSVLLENVLNPDMKTREDLEVLSLKSILQSKLQFYRSAGLSGIKVLLKAEKIQKSDCRFYELDQTLTLQENLEQRTIIEHPTVYVILNHNIDMYDIIDSDDEEKKQVNPQRNPPQRRRFKGNRNHRNYPIHGIFKQNEATIQNQNQDKEAETDPINLLFHTEFSDSEDEKAKAEREKNEKMRARKRKLRRNQSETIQKKAKKVIGSLSEFTGICVSDSEDETLAKKKIFEAVIPSAEINSTELVKVNEDLVNGKCKVGKPLSNSFFDSHITDSEDEGPDEEVIKRFDPAEFEKSVEKKSSKTENNNENNNSDNNKEKENKESNAAIQSIAMNYFSAYMSDSENEIESENNPKSENAGLQIPHYNDPVKM